MYMCDQLVQLVPMVMSGAVYTCLPFESNTEKLPLAALSDITV